jgi:signal transduction histidine kinase
MADADLVDRLAALPHLADIPREELQWLVAHGQREVYEIGAVVGPKGQAIDKLHVVLSGHIGIRVDRGAGPRRVADWHTGDVTGMLPYSRMTGPPGDNVAEEATETLAVDIGHFPEMTQRCPVFTAHTVHVMLDRARNFNTSALQDEKMISLGRLAAGLAHELNNPASAVVRGAKMLLAGLAEADDASRSLGAAGLPDDLNDAIEQLRSACLARLDDGVLSPIELANREDEIAEWLVSHQSDQAYATPLADMGVTVEALDSLAEEASGDTLNAAVRWIAANCTTGSLAIDIEQAATRIYELVSAVKRFTYMDNLAGPEFVDVEGGLRDTIRVLASKAKSKGAAVTLDIEADLPRVHANGGELNQVWMNLIDNALDAIAESGRVDISARVELDRVVVHVVDDGPGIPADVLPRIFDPFFTTKPPGQATGLGLEIAQRLVRRYNGDIYATSQPGRTEFCVSLLVEEPQVAGHA